MVAQIDAIEAQKSLSMKTFQKRKITMTLGMLVVSTRLISCIILHRRGLDKSLKTSLDGYVTTSRWLHNVLCRFTV